jgi:hypothetical protein
MDRIYLKNRSCSTSHDCVVVILGVCACRHFDVGLRIFELYWRYPLHETLSRIHFAGQMSLLIPKHQSDLPSTFLVMGDYCFTDYQNIDPAGPIADNGYRYHERAHISAQKPCKCCPSPCASSPLCRMHNLVSHSELSPRPISRAMPHWP